MFCRNCGNEIKENTNFCPTCGVAQQATSEIKGEPNKISNPFKIPFNGTKSVQPPIGKQPKCTHCGYVGAWKLGPILRPIDFIIGIALLFLGFIPGLVYLGVVALIRSNPDRREKICPDCKAQNMWTFMDK